ncbi:MAG: hypothetical protein ACREQD_04735, partial [Candidatus Binataceae bacterium]
QVVSSLAHAVSGATSASVSYEVSTILREVTEQMLLPPEQRQLTAVLEKLNQPEILRAANSGRLPLDFARIRKLQDEFRLDESADNAG